ncbi:MAG: NAD-dependent epimerase/dehydratase family protein [Fibrobacter sp.]|nr:NAD-dependent epimerase/dehydratase family protein [Fibrobacter sp.]
MNSNKTALITGITGFVGTWLSNLLQSEGYSVYGFDRWNEFSNQSINYSQIDILDSLAIGKLLESVRPDHIYHLAAISYLPEADISPRHAMNINIMGTISLLDAVKQFSPNSKVLLVGSSKEYDDSINSESVSEITHPFPTNFYGISKYAGELLGQQYCRQFNIDVRCTRSFNHTGPGQSPRFVCSDWAKQVAEIEAGLRAPQISVGNLEPVIDFSDVRDVVRAYYLILTSGNAGEIYNVCSGRGIALKQILDILIKKSSKNITVQLEDKKLRAHKTNTIMIGDNSKLRNSTSWNTQYQMSETLEDLMSYWNNELRAEK